MRLAVRHVAVLPILVLAFAVAVLTAGASDAWAARQDTRATRPAAKPAPAKPQAARPAAVPARKPVAAVTQRGRPTVRAAAPAARPALKSGRGTRSGNIKSAKLRVAPVRYAGISCVPYARSVSGMDVKGNAHAWWQSAAGIYERGARPEAGSVLNFRATARMRLGHVAVVTRVIDSRTVEVDHANWAGPGGRKGQVAQAVPVIDVSERNDWSEVRVALQRGGAFGSVYPTYGFIYDRPDRGIMVANTLARPSMRVTEVAEDGSSRRSMPSPAAASGIDAPVRSLR